MSTKPPDKPIGDAPINPAIKREMDASHGTKFEGTDPMRTVSVKDPDEGSSWPMIWLVVGVVCVLVASYAVLTCRRRPHRRARLSSAVRRRGGRSTTTSVRCRSDRRRRSPTARRAASR